nr:pesticin C-terminus-like muramidase [uncultured Ottowia sp.]
MTQSEFFHHGDRRSFPISSPGQTPPIGTPRSTWRPADLVVSKDGAISIDRATEEINGRNMLKGENNRSGVTIGVGVDLGQQAPEAYKDRLRNFGIKQELIAKLEPYMGLIRGQAIEKLKEKPLSLSKQEVEQVVAEMKNEMLKDLAREYKDLTKDIKKHREFKELAIEEQTILFSRKWQNGNLQIPASKAIAKSFSLGLVRDALDKLVPANYPGQEK